MNFQVLRGAIFAFVDGLEERVLDGMEDVERTVTNLVETGVVAIRETMGIFSGLIFNSTSTIISEAFNLFRAGLAVVLGRPAEDEEGN